ncbi:ATP-binding protein [Paraglaciecola aestuariivivens]
MKVFVIEDNLDHLQLVEDALYAIVDTDVHMDSAHTLADGVKALKAQEYDVCLCDLKLPDSPIELTVEFLRSHSLNLPIIILTSLNSVELAKSLLRSGVQDFIPKEELSPNLLFRTCRYAIDRWKHQFIMDENNKDMQAFCASLSHDFNGHISRIMSVSEAIKISFEKRLTFTEDDKQWFSYLDKSTNAIMALVGNLQQYLNLGHSAREFKQISLDKVLEYTKLSIKMASEKAFTFDYPEQLPKIMGNAELMQLMFQNLISNSIKFNENSPHISLTCQTEDNLVILTLTDNGIGFDPTQAEKVFSPFYRLANGKKFGGSGLGLSIVKRVVEHHRGNISVTSEEGKGTSFTLKFPITQPSQ